jgi:hypothetical protein
MRGLNQNRQTSAHRRDLQVPGTPCIVVDGKYRIELDSLARATDVIDLVNFLIRVRP